MSQTFYHSAMAESQEEGRAGPTQKVVPGRGNHGQRRTCVVTPHLVHDLGELAALHHLLKDPPLATGRFVTTGLNLSDQGKPH